MTPNDVKVVLHEVLGGGVFLTTSAFVIFVCGWLVAVALAAGVGAFFGKRAETAAVKRDLKTIIESLRQTTAATEDIKANIAGGLWVEQSRWTFKAGFYKELLEALGVLASSLNHIITLDQLQAASKDQAERDELEGRERQYDEQASEAFGRVIKCEAVARAWLGQEAQKALDTFADDWSKAWVGGMFGIARTRQMKIAAVKVHDLLLAAVEDDLQLRRTP